MTRYRTPSKSTCHVLAALQDRPEYGYALMKATSLKSGTLYPILMRLKDRGFVTSQWEAPASPGRPSRQVYSLTPAGRDFATAALNPKTSSIQLKGLMP